MGWGGGRHSVGGYGGKNAQCSKYAEGRTCSVAGVGTAMVQCRLA